ncbi:MAG: lipopolysaccharide heptosyltransferase II [Thiomonas sp.]|nr:lipopolysaccharide heptosyltransferase II [Thiomonas sp.]
MTRVLLIAPQWIGDAVMAQPLVALLAARGEQVTALGLPSVAPVLRAMPGVVGVIEAPFVHGKLDFKLRRHLAAQLRQQEFQRAYILGNNLKSRLVPWLAGIPQRIGHAGEARGLLLTDSLESDAPRGKPRPSEPLALSPVACRIPRDASSARPDMRQHYAALARLATGGPDLPAPEPTLMIPGQAASEARQQFGLFERWIALCPGAEYGPAKQWPVAHYAALATLAQQAGYGVAVLGAPRDAAAGDAIAGHAPGALNLCGATRLDEAIALLASSSGVVSNDSGLMHIAAALERPTIGVYGSTDPRHTPPAAHRSAALWLQLDCSPCFQRTCPLGHLDCLRRIAPDAVWHALKQLMP